MEITHDIKNIMLTSGEISELFNAYLNNNAAKYVLSYFLEKAQDPEIKATIKLASDDSIKNMEGIKAILNSVGHPIPKGFSEEDVNTKAEKLYSDCFMLTYVRFMARFGLTNYAEARAASTRSDVRSFFNQAINSAIELFNMADIVMLNKGLFSKEPHIPIPNEIDMVEKQSFLNGFFGVKRALNATEISRLTLIFYRNSLGKAFLTGLSQNTENKKLKEYFIRGINLSQQHMQAAGELLINEDLPTPIFLDSEVTTSTERVFSDKLMMFHVVALAALGLATAGISLAKVMRRDLSLALTKFIAEISLYTEDGINIMIENKWFERIPEAADRKKLL